MRFLAAVVGASSAFVLGVHGNFVSSLHSNYVVNLDFEGDTRRSLAVDAEGGVEKAEDDPNVQVMAFAGGKRKFRCKLPAGNNATSATAGSSETSDVVKSKAHFISAKLVNLKGTCWKMRKDYWSYDVCFGRKIVQYRADSDMRFSLGEFKTGSEELTKSGGVREIYVGGTDNRTSEIQYVCGSSESESRTFKLEEPRPLYYVWTISGPQFCAWKEKDGEQARTPDGGPLMVSALLEEMRGACVNVTQGWWTYEYCYPTGLQQFHQTGNAKNPRDPEHALGSLKGTGGSEGVNQVEMSTVRLKPSISPRERRAPPSNHRTLRQRLGGGTVCDETGKPRATTMHFQCPQNWQTQPETRIVSINEGSLCEYEMLIHTTLLCGHEKFLPTMPRGKETIQCVVEP